MRASAITKALTAASANAIALSQSLAAAGALTLNGASASGGVATLDTQRRVIITSAGADAGLTWTIIGTDDNGNPIKDSFAGASSPAVAASNLDFKTVTSITSSGATAAAVTAGTNTTGSSPWDMFDDNIPTPNISGDLILVTGAGTASWEYTYDPFLVPIPYPMAPTSPIALAAANPNPLAHGVTNMTAITSSKDGSINFPIHAQRLTITLGTGTWKLTTRQAGVSSP